MISLSNYGNDLIYEIGAEEEGIIANMRPRLLTIPAIATNCVVFCGPSCGAFLINWSFVLCTEQRGMRESDMANVVYMANVI